MIEAAAKAEGVDVVEAARERRGHRDVVRVVIHSGRGVTHADCERVTRAVSAGIEAHSIIPGSYLLEVSSPGIDRVFKSPREFDLFRGRPIRVRFLDSEEREILGVAEGTREGQRVAMRVEGGEENVVPWAQIARVRLEPEAIGPGRKEGRGA